MNRRRIRTASDNVRDAVRAWKPVARDAIAESTRALGLTDPKRRLRGALSIATFHRVLTKEQRDAYPLPGLAVTPDELDWFLKYFAASYECGPLTEVVSRWLRGDERTRPFLALTFDDGQLDNYVNARPLLTRYGLRASFYVPVLMWIEAIPFGMTASDSRRCRSSVKEMVAVA